MHLIVHVAAPDTQEVLEPNIHLRFRLKGCRAHRDPGHLLSRQCKGLNVYAIRLSS